jgi:hypothetical protein
VSEIQTTQQQTDDVVWKPNGVEHDVVWGAEAIGAVVNLKPNQVYHLASLGKLPVKKVGKMLCGSRRKLLAAVGGA